MVVKRGLPTLNIGCFRYLPRLAQLHTFYGFLPACEKTKTIPLTDT